jgi:class 3 adenylate cyclase
MGDGVLAYFGYPQAHEDDGERAVRAGLQIVTTARPVPAAPRRQTAGPTLRGAAMFRGCSMGVNRRVDAAATSSPPEQGIPGGLGPSPQRPT